LQLCSLDCLQQPRQICFSSLDAKVQSNWLLAISKRKKGKKAKFALT